jgi:hypothetical protein
MGKKLILRKGPTVYPKRKRKNAVVQKVPRGTVQKP